MMTPEQLSAIQARADDKRLPPAPWRWHYYSQYREDDRGTLHAPCTPSIIAGDVDEVTGQFMAKAREDIPALLDEVRRLRELCAECIESIDDWAVYASPHFREKYGLDAEIEGYKARLNGAESEGGNGN